MTPTVDTCSACNKSIKKIQYLKCTLCAKVFDLECANINNKKFNVMSSVSKKTWKCVECRFKPPLSQTTDTPSGMKEISTSPNSPELSNITLRNKPSYISTESVESHTSYITEDKLRSILKQEITQIIKHTIEGIVSDQLRNINEQISGFQETMTFFNGLYEDLKNKLEEKTATITKLQADNVELKTTAKELSTRLSLVEQHMRENNVEIVGLPEFRNENLSNTIMQLTKVVDSPLVDDDILHVTRVAKMDKNSGKPRSIVVKLRSPRKRDILLAAVSNYNKKNPRDKLSSQHLGLGGPKLPIFVAEHLTPSNKFLHAAARKKAKEHAYKYIWVRNSRIFIRKDDTSQAIAIRSIDSLNLIV